MSEKYLNVRVSENDFRALQKLADKKIFMNVSDAVRTAIRKLIDEYKHFLMEEAEVQQQ